MATSPPDPNGPFATALLAAFENALDVMLKDIRDEQAGLRGDIAKLSAKIDAIDAIDAIDGKPD